MTESTGTKDDPWVLHTAPGTSYRGRFGMYPPSLLEALGLAGLTHDARNNSMRAV
jgi:hypothetical protein